MNGVGERVVGQSHRRSRGPCADCPLLFGRVLDGRGGGRSIGWTEAKQWTPVNDKEVLWLHLDRTLPGVREWLQEALQVSEPTTELLTSDDTRPRAFRERQTLVATLRTINFNPGADPEDMVSMQLWSDGRRLLTMRRHPLQSRAECLAMLDGRDDGPDDVGSLITQLVEHMIQRMNRTVVDMNEQIDALFEIDCDTEDANDVLTRISAIRRDCLALKRHMGPEHVALEAMSREAP
jgi:zinc transporter